MKNSDTIVMTTEKSTSNNSFSKVVFDYRQPVRQGLIINEKKQDVE